jgi:hypothetical protein
VFFFFPIIFVFTEATNDLVQLSWVLTVATPNFPWWLGLVNHSLASCNVFRNITAVVTEGLLYMRFEVFMVVNIWFVVFWVMVPCCLVVFQRNLLPPSWRWM